MYIYFLYSSDIITYYYVPYAYNFMLFVYVIKLLIILYLVHWINWIELNWIELNKHVHRLELQKFFFIFVLRTYQLG